MGKATVVSGGTDGNYTVAVDAGDAVRTARVAKLNAQLAALVGTLATAQAALDTQQAIEDAQKVVVEASITAYTNASQSVPAAFASIAPAQAAADDAADALHAIVGAATGTLPDVTALQATLVELLATQLSLDDIEQDTSGLALAAVQNLGASLTDFEVARETFDAAEGSFRAAQSVVAVKALQLVTALQAGGDTTAEQVAYLTATTDAATRSTDLQAAMVTLKAAHDRLVSAQVDVIYYQQQQPIDTAAALTAGNKYAVAGQALLAVYMADGDVNAGVKGGTKANLDALFDVYSDAAVGCQITLDELSDKHSAHSNAEPDHAVAVTQLLSMAANLRAAANAVVPKRDDYVANALAAPAVFDVVALAYTTQRDAYASTEADYTDQYTAHNAAADALATAIQDLQVAAAVANVWLVDVRTATADYAEIAQPILTGFTLTSTAIDRERDAAQAELTAAQAAYASAKAAYEAAQKAMDDALKAYTTGAVKLLDEKRKTAPLRLTLERLQSEQAQAIKDRMYWAGMVLTKTQQAWCIDLTEDATGSVATVEIPGEDKLILIAPAAPAPAAEHGVLAAREVQTGAQAFFNAAILPGWQKWKPTYRRGTLTAINGAADTANVTLDDDVSSAQGLSINQTPTLANVPVKYMTCNSNVFAVGDRVVIKFKSQDWAQPEVVGFESHPKGCGLVLSGLVRDPLVVDLPIPEGSPPGTLARKALRSYQPTAQAWQYPLRSDPAKSPTAWHDEPLLGGQGTLYADVCASMYSGRMAQAVQIMLGQGIAVPYDYMWAHCHGITTGADGALWVVEISAAHGVIAQRLSVGPVSASSPQDVMRAAHALFGGLVVPRAFPADAAMAAALSEGSVIQLATAADLAAYFDKTAFVPEMGWSFNSAGSAAHNTCWAHGTVDATQVFSYHYKLDISIGPVAASPRTPGTPVAVGSAVLTEVETGELTISIGGGIYAANWVPFLFYDIAGQPHQVPAKHLDYDDAVSITLTAPLVVFFAGDVLEVVRVIYDNTEHSERIVGQPPSSDGTDTGYSMGSGSASFQTGGVNGRVVLGQRIRMYRFRTESFRTYTAVSSGQENFESGAVINYTGFRVDNELRTLTGGMMFWTPFCRDSVSRSVDSYDMIFTTSYGIIHSNADIVGGGEASFSVVYSTKPNPNISEADPRVTIPFAQVQLGFTYTYYDLPYAPPGRRPGYVATLWPDGTLSDYTDPTDVTAGFGWEYGWAGNTRMVCSMLGAEPERAIEYFRYPLFKGPHIAPEAATPLPVRDYNFLGYV